MTDQSGEVVWSWFSAPFGSSPPDTDPDGDGIDVDLNLRFPGQYFDHETGFHYNHYRTYDPSTGRYLESDPIGVAGGLNTYGYVASNPLSFVDPLELFEIYGHQTRGGGDGWETRFEFVFSPLSEKPGDLGLKLWKLGNRTQKLLDLVKTDPVGPRRPVVDGLACALLDAKLEREYTDRFGDENRLTREQALDFLDAMRNKYPEMNNLYGPPKSLLDTAELNSKDHWFYQMRPGE